MHVGPGVTGQPCSCVTLAHNQVTEAGGVGFHLDSPSFLAHGNHIVVCAYVGMELASAGVAEGYLLQGNQCRDGKGATKGQCVAGAGVYAEGTEV